MSDAAATYDIGINLKKVGDGWDDLSAGVGSFTGMLDRAAGKLASLGSYAAFGAATAGLTALTWSVTHLNAQAEGAAISLGTIFSVNGLAGDVPSGIKLAGDTIAKMRIDAQKLPGEFEDLQTIFTMGATSAFRSGASIDQWRQMSANAMAAGATLMMPMDQVAREMTQLMEGHAGSHNVFGSKLGFTGDEARKLNAMPGDKRRDAITGELTKFSGALDVFSRSYEGVSSTLEDNLKSFARVATEGIFDELKTSMGSVNHWFSENQDKVDAFAHHLGHRLVDAFEWGKEKILEWYPLVENFATVAYQRMSDFWDGVEPYVQSFASAMKDALADPNGTITSLTRLFELYATLKVGSAGFGIAGGLYDASRGAGGMLAGWMGKGAGAAGGAAASVAGNAAYSGAFGSLGGVAPAAESSAVALSGLGASATVAGGVFLGAVAAWGWAVYEAVGLSDELQRNQQLDAQARGEAAGREIESMIAAGDSWEAISNQMDSIRARFSTTEDMMDTTGKGLGEFGRVTDEAGLQIANLAMQAAVAAGSLATVRPLPGAFDWAPGQASEPLKPKPSMKGGHGGTSIQKVEIVVTSNQNPSRIALAVHAQLAGLSTNKRYSPDVPNFSAPDEGG